MQKRSWSKDTFPGRWGTSCAGHCDAGESYDETARRELAEELGVTAINLEKLFKADACGETGAEFVWVYRGHHEGPFHLNTAEISLGNWMFCEEVDSQVLTSPNLFTPSFIYLWGLYRERYR